MQTLFKSFPKFTQHCEASEILWGEGFFALLSFLSCLP